MAASSTSTVTRARRASITQYKPFVGAASAASSSPAPRHRTVARQRGRAGGGTMDNAHVNVNVNVNVNVKGSRLKPLLQAIRVRRETPVQREIPVRQ